MFPKQSQHEYLSDKMKKVIVHKSKTINTRLSTGLDEHICYSKLIEFLELYHLI